MQALGYLTISFNIERHIIPLLLLVMYILDILQLGHYIEFLISSVCRLCYFVCRSIRYIFQRISLGALHFFLIKSVYIGLEKC